MSQIGRAQSRTTSLLSSSRMLASLQRTERALAEVQEQISTGRRLEKPSDAPARTSAVLALESTIEARDQHERNLQHALGVLNNTDQALGDATDILLEAGSIASSQVGIGSSAEIRANHATVIDAQIRSLIDIANRQYQGVSLFGGNRSAPRNEPVFVEQLGGVRYLGARTNLAGDVGLPSPLDINSNGQEAFGALSTRVLSQVDLDPAATADTRIDDVNGVLDQPVRLGSLVVTIDGAPVTVDLKTAETLGDVQTRTQNAIDSIDPTAGSFQVWGFGFELTAAGGHTLSIGEVGNGKTAADLGIVLTSSGVTAVGADIDPHLTGRTKLADLGVPVDLASGLLITQGAVTKVTDFSGAITIEDMINVIDQLGLGLRMEINETRTGLNLVSEISGLDLSIGENVGGTTATDLGLRTFGQQTLLSDFRFGLGVENFVGEDDFAVELHDGRSFSVNIDGLATVGEVIAAMTSAAGAAGLTTGSPGALRTDFNIGLAEHGNGFQMADGTVGAGVFRIVQLGRSLAATHLSIYENAGAGNQIISDDVTKVRAESIFTHMINFRDALLADDSFGIAIAGEGMDGDAQMLAGIRADVGSRAQRVEHYQDRSAELKITEQSLLSHLQDTEYTEAITRFLQLQQQFEASLRVGLANLQLSLLDFLR